MHAAYTSLDFPPTPVVSEDSEADDGLLIVPLPVSDSGSFYSAEDGADDGADDDSDAFLSCDPEATV